MKKQEKHVFEVDWRVDSRHTAIDAEFFMSRLL